MHAVHTKGVEYDVDTFRCQQSLKRNVDIARAWLFVVVVFVVVVMASAIAAATAAATATTLVMIQNAVYA